MEFDSSRDEFHGSKSNNDKKHSHNVIVGNRYFYQNFYFSKPDSIGEAKSSLTHTYNTQETNST